MERADRRRPRGPARAHRPIHRVGWRITVRGATGQVVNYRAVPDWHTAVPEITGGRGVDRVGDTAGTLEQSVKSLAVNGHVALVGSLSRDWRPLDPRLLFGVAATVRAWAVRSYSQFAQLNEIITTHPLRPVIDRVFPFEEAGAAYRYYESANPIGKVIINIR